MIAVLLLSTRKWSQGLPSGIYLFHNPQEAVKWKIDVLASAEVLEYRLGKGWALKGDEHYFDTAEEVIGEFQSTLSHLEWFHQFEVHNPRK